MIMRPCNVNRETCNEISGPWNVSRGPLNVNRERVM